MFEEQPAQYRSTDPPFEIGIVQIVSEQAAQLLRGVLPLASGEGEDARPVRSGRPLISPGLAMPGNKVDDFHRIRVGQRGLLLQIFACQLVKRAQISIAKRWARGVKRSEEHTSELQSPDH